MSSHLIQIHIDTSKEGRKNLSLLLSHLNKSFSETDEVSVVIFHKDFIIKDNNGEDRYSVSVKNIKEIKSIINEYISRQSN